MKNKIKEQLSLNCQEYNLIKLINISLLMVLMGIFLLPKTAYLASISPEEIIELTNKERSMAGLEPLIVNSKLSQAAVNKANAIFKYQNFSHTVNNTKFSAWIKEADYQYQSVGENLAIDFNSSKKIIDAWIKSPTHQINLLNPTYSEIGVAAIENKFEDISTTVVVQIFGTPLNNTTANTHISDFTQNPGSKQLDYSEISSPLPIFAMMSQSINRFSSFFSKIDLSFIIYISLANFTVLIWTIELLISQRFYVKYTAIATQE